MKVFGSWLILVDDIIGKYLGFSFLEVFVRNFMSYINDFVRIIVGVWICDLILFFKKYILGVN